MRTKITEERDVILGIRPEHVLVSKTAIDDYIPCHCNFSEPLGSRLLLMSNSAGDVDIKVKVPTETALSVGDRLYMHFPEENIMLFDDKTEQAL